MKIDRKSFAHGAMRECFRMKKLSNFSNSSDWGRDSNNYVAKRYMDPTDREIHFQVGFKSKKYIFRIWKEIILMNFCPNCLQDVKLQMDAKLWAEEYNRHNPPKKVRFGWVLSGLVWFNIFSAKYSSYKTDAIYMYQSSCHAGWYLLMGVIVNLFGSYLVWFGGVWYTFGRI